MQFPLARFQLALASAALLTLAACSGGSSTPAAPTATTLPPAEVTSVSGVVADGLIKGATVCYDLNDNGVCDTGEPTSSTTNDKGVYQLSVPAAEAGKHGIIAMVPATAEDQDNPGVPVGTAFTMKSPPQTDTSKPVHVTPITTAVAEIMTAAGTKDPAAAIEQVKQQLGLTASPLDNFVAARDTGTQDQKDEAARTSKMAQILVEITKEVVKVTTAANVGDEGARALNRQTMLNTLSNLADTVANQGSGTTANALAKTVLTNQGLTTATAVVQAAIAVQVAKATTDTAPASSGPVSFITLRDLNYTNASNWNYRIFTGTDVADADGFKYTNDLRRATAAGADVPYNRDASYFNTTAGKWYECPSDGYLTIQSKDATATTDASSLGCRTYAGTSKRTNESIAGSNMRDVVTRIRASGLPRGTGTSTYATWGPDPSLVSSTATFPAGSVLRYQVDSPTATPDGHSLSSKARVPRDPTKAFDLWPFAANLDEYISYYSGDLTGSTTINGGNTDGLRDIPFPSLATATRSGAKNYRVAYKATSATGGMARFYLCGRSTEVGTVGFTRDCVATGADTTYTIETKADARLIRLATYPAENEGFHKSRRVMVERAGAVFYGFKDSLLTTTTIRLNKDAWVALRTALAIPPHTDPSAPVPVEAASWLRDMRENIDGSFNYRLIKSTGSGTGTTNEIRKFISSMGTSLPWYRNSLFLNGSGWDEACPNNGINIGTFSSSPRSGTSCNGLFTDTSTGFDVDISSRTMASVFAEIRLFSGRDGSSDYSNYGPTPSTGNAFLNTATFPAGSTMRYQVITNTGTTDNIAVPNRVDTNSPAGSVLNTNDAVGVPPSPTTALPYTSWTFVTTLADMVAAYSGDFVTGQVINGVTTLGLYSYFPTPNTNTNPAYTGQRRIRAAFQGTATAGAVRYYLCDQAAGSLFTTNCTQTGTGTYAVAPSGGKNVLRFTNLPSDLNTVGAFERVFVENAGSVYFGGRGLVGRKNQSIRLNETAYNAFFSAVSQTPPTVTCTVAPCP